MKAPEASPTFAAALTRLYAAMAEVANGNTAAIKALYSRSPDATSFYGWGGYEKGWEEVERRWAWAGDQFKGGTVAYHHVTRIETDALAYTTDIETFEVLVAGMDKPTRWSNRVTHVFRREDDGWRLIHRHANRLEDKYAPSSRLKPSAD